jgi:glycosyltransferase involved in cell wall biosynthesis
MTQPHRKSVLLIEQALVGHHGPYLVWIAQGLARAGFAVHIAVPKEVMVGTAYDFLIQKIKGFAVVRGIEGNIAGSNSIRMGPLALALTQIKAWLYFRYMFQQVASSADVDFVFVPYLDNCTYVLGFLGSPFSRKPWGGIVMRPAFHYRAMNVIAHHSALMGVKEKLFQRVLYCKSLTALFTIDEVLHQYVHQQKLKNATKLLYLPDPAPVVERVPKTAARERLGIPIEAVVILAYGAIHERKGVIELLDAVVEDICPSDVHVLLAGVQDKKVQAAVWAGAGAKLTASGRLHNINSYLSTEDEGLVLGASDMVWVGYREHFQMSGILALAGRCGLPVLACREGLIGWLTSRYGSGVVVSPEDRVGVAGAIRELMDRPGTIEEMGRKAEGAYHDHDVIVAGRIISEALSTALAKTDKFEIE